MRTVSNHAASSAAASSLAREERRLRRLLLRVGGPLAVAAGSASPPPKCPSMFPEGKEFSMGWAVNLTIEQQSEVLHKEICKDSSEKWCAFPPKDLQAAGAGALSAKPEAMLDQAVLNLDQDFFVRRLKGVGSNESVEDDETKNYYWLVLFYNEACGTCQKFAPRWLSFGTVLREQRSRTRLAAVNCHKYGSVCGAAGINQVPAVMGIYRGDQSVMRKHLLGPSGGSIMKWTHNRTISVPNMTDEALTVEDKLPRHLDGLPGDFGLSAQKVEDSLKAGHSTCPRQRDINKKVAGADGFAMMPATGWPVKELQATPDVRLKDAGYAAVSTLSNYIRPKDGKDAFSTQELRDVAKWVSLLKSNFPAAKSELARLHSTLQDLLRTGETLCAVEWINLVDAVASKLGGDSPPLGGSEMMLCTTETCRLWTLFHILSLAPSANHDGAMGARSTLEAIFLFISTFFDCSICRNHALQAYNDGLYQKDTLIEKRGADGLVLYMWRFHNAVSLRIAKEQDCEADRRWPPADLCPTCWSSSAREKLHADEVSKDLDTAALSLSEEYHEELDPVMASADEDEVLVFMKQTMWPRHAERAGADRGAIMGFGVLIAFILSFLAAFQLPIT
eukprot:gnl/TRDRNA2_/TRDRNA2_130885_c0_seq1.p1 gnl/TRDRNA2_/TRDRNA2_130885_c0~~gnl/TRDRNA2_/TRDRNA2_130885_c0_seq1.p1  ORF type:complete len:648 (+),score=125.94 gnl/TRDRNA2_/TRDRNA2_130885_c0_seq1:91-1944(+)